MYNVPHVVMNFAPPFSLISDIITGFKCSSHVLSASFFLTGIKFTVTGYLMLLKAHIYHIHDDSYALQMNEYI